MKWLSVTLTESGDHARLQVFVAAVVGMAFLLRLLYAAHVELLPEEAYYWNYSRHLDIGYLDHPPMVAWLIRIGTVVFGTTEFGVRAGALCCGAVTTLALHRMTRNVFGEPSALIAIALAQALPFFFLSGTLMTPDAPLTAAWAAALFFFERALIGGRSAAWIGVGIAMGLGMISKYTIGLLGVAALVFMLIDPPSRRWFRRWQPYAALVIAILLFAPVIAWNDAHEWASFAFQTSRRLAESPRFSLHKLLGAALVLLNPVGLLAATIAVADADTRDRAQRWLRAAVLTPLAVFAVFSLRHEVKLDWTGALWTAALPLMAFGLTQAIGRAAGRPWLRTLWPPTIAAMLSVYGVGLCYLTCGIPGVGYTRHIELLPVEWRDFARQADAVANAARAQFGERVLLVGMDRYALASELAFYSADRDKAVANTSSAHLFDDVGLMYEQWFPVQLQAGKTLVLMAWDPADLAASRFGDRVSALDPLQEGVLSRGGSMVRRYYFRIAHDYKYTCGPVVRYTFCAR